MLAEVGTSVCMGNGYDHVQAKADFVTEDNDHDGVWNACVRLGLFDEPFWQER
jgi:hydroxymethylpyrimidine pyrophosphatase-like HAD family hydrolase